MASRPHTDPVDWTRRRLVGAIAGAALAAPFVRGRRLAGSEPITLRYTSHIPRSHGLYTEGFVPLTEMLDRETGGRLRLQAFTDKLLHGPLDGFKAAISGITDYTHAYATYQPGSFRLLHALQLPFLFPRPAVAALVAEELYPRFFKTEYERMGVYLAHCDSTSPYDIISKDPIRTLEDLRGVKIRVTGGLSVDIFRALGGVPTVMAAAEVYPAFQRGVVDAVALGAPDIVAYRLHEIGRHFTKVGINVTVLQHCLRRGAFDGLPADLKSTFYRLLRVRSQLPAHNYYGGVRADQALDALALSGVELIELSELEADRWRAAVDPLTEEYLLAQEASGLEPRAVVAEAKRLANAYAPLSDAQLLERVTEYPTQGIIDF